MSQNSSTGLPRHPVFRPDLLTGRVALVTGGGTGLGLETAKTLARLGAHVVLAGRREDVVSQAARSILDRGDSASGFAVDVRAYDAVAEMVRRVVDDRGALDILVNNAAGNFRCDTEKLTPNGWRTILDIDLNGTFNCSHAAFEALSGSRHVGRIVNMITSYAWTGWPGCAAAAAAKAGIQSLTRTLAVEWGPRNVLSNTVAPGAIEDTEGTARLHGDERASAMLGRIPVGRLGTKPDIASAVAYLVSDAGIYVNGTDLVVDGGRQFAFG